MIELVSENFRVKSRISLIKTVGLAYAGYKIDSRISSLPPSDLCANFAELKGISAILKFVIPSFFSYIGVISCEELLNISLSEYKGEMAAFTRLSACLASSSSICGIAALIIKY